MKTVDCIILAMLKEERDLFLKSNNCLIYDNTLIHEDFLEFNFFDKDNKLRSGVFCSSDREMGNNEASKLFYKISRNFQSELFINIGVAGYIKEVSIGDVIIVNDNYSLCEKNVANSSLQKTDAQLDKNFIKNNVYNPLERSFGEIFKDKTSSKMHELHHKLDSYISNHVLKENIISSLKDICQHNNNQINLGACATYHSVVKDKKTRKAIEDVRKTNIVDMEAYYFNDWHKLIRTEEYPTSLKNSKMIIIKSISDTALKEEKAILEAIGSRSLAMSNIYDIVTYFISNIYSFSISGEDSLENYFNEKISNRHISKLINYSNEAYDSLNALCSDIIINDNICGANINGDYINTVCNILTQDDQILVLQGNPGKGKSTFISYVYKKLTQNQKAIFISIPELLNKNNISSEQTLFLLEKLLINESNITVFVDGVEGSRQKKSEENKRILEKLIMILNQHSKRNISLCIGTWHTNDINDIKREILSKIHRDNNVSTLTFKSVSALDKSIDNFISRFSKFYKITHPDFDDTVFVSNVKRIVKSNDFKLKYVDFRLLHIFAKNKQTLLTSDSIFDFIRDYCTSKAPEGLECEISDVENILNKNTPEDKHGLLTKNIYSRAYLFAYFIYSAFTNRDVNKINCILSNEYILSDNINLYLEYMIRSYGNSKDFVNNVICNLHAHSNCKFCSKIQLIYNISSIANITYPVRNTLKNIILNTINLLDKYDLSTQESDAIIGYRTLSIILNNKFGISDYLNKFNSILSSNDFSKFEAVRKINLNFHLMYYSQMEFTYNKVEGDTPFEPEVIWNTYQILKNSITSDKYTNEYVESCAITLLQLIQYIQSVYQQLSDSFTVPELSNCLKVIQTIQVNKNLSYLKVALDNFTLLY